MGSGLDPMEMPPTLAHGGCFRSSKGSRRTHLAGLQLSIATVFANQGLIGLLERNETATGVLHYEVPGWRRQETRQDVR